ncbi:MAG: hypothetical protein A3D35_02980, partial [Candidatus Staskawiczbacteria bacterium RIFCSPHIGHO2_02_FULL_34_9]
MKFSYRARTQDGKVEIGTIEAYSKEAAVSLLQKYNIFVTSLSENKGKYEFITKFQLFGSGVSKKDLAIFFRQLAVMLESRVPVVQSLSSLAGQSKKSRFRETINKIAGLVEEGIPLSDAFAFHPKVFSSFYVNLIKSGEASGQIAKTLYYVSDNLEREHDIISEVRQAMIYPIFLVVVLTFVMGIIIIEVMPKISDIISQSSTTPSFTTLLVLNFYKFIQNYWSFMLIGLAIFIFVIVYYLSTKQGREYYDKVSLKIPLLGEFLKKVFLVRFCGNISTLLLAGIPIHKTLEIAADTVNNSEYKKIISKMQEEVSAGEKISSVMIKNQEYFPLFVVQMVKVGEETGKLDKVLMDVVSFYDKDIKRSIDLFSRLLEPIMIIVLGG